MKLALLALGASLTLAGCASGPKDEDHAAHHPPAAAATTPGTMQDGMGMMGRMRGGMGPGGAMGMGGGGMPMGPEMMGRRMDMMEMMMDRDGVRPPASPAR